MLLTEKEWARLDAAAEVAQGAGGQRRIDICRELIQALQTLGRVREMLVWVDDWLCDEAGVYRDSYESRAVDIESRNCYNAATDAV